MLVRKLRIYSLPPTGAGADEEKACVAWECQRQAGDAFEFRALYRRALGFLEQCWIPTASSTQELFLLSATGGCFTSVSSRKAQAAQADASAAVGKGVGSTT